MCYTLIKKILFYLPPEKAHDFTLKALYVAEKLKLIRYSSVSFSPREVMGLSFPNLIGLAAGL